MFSVIEVPYSKSCRARKADTLTTYQTGSVGSVSRTVSQHKLTDVLTALTIFKPSPVSSAITRVHFPAEQVNITPTASSENRSVADKECSISFASDIIVPQLTLESEADFNQLVKYENDSHSYWCWFHRFWLRGTGLVKSWIRFDVLGGPHNIKVHWRTVIHTAWMLLQMFKWEHLLRFNKYE